jgi:CubicO group peptidase (beta-lactamase class C family)
LKSWPKVLQIGNAQRSGGGRSVGLEPARRRLPADRERLSSLLMPLFKAVAFGLNPFMQNPVFGQWSVAALIVAAVFSPVHSASATDRSQVIAASLQPFVDRHVLPGAVTLVATKDQVVSLQSVGYSDLASRKRMPTDALFWIASQSKPMTAAALMMLIDEGKMKLDDPVERFLPEFKGLMVVAERDDNHVLLRKPGHPIKVRELLSHTSGLPFKSPMEEPTLDLLPLGEAVRSYTLVPLQFEPGTKYQYSNAGINTVGRIIEIVSGLPYETFMDQRLFKPLGMKDTTFWPNSSQVRRLAKSYRASADHIDLEETTITQLRYPLNDRKRQPMPAGGLFSTARDVGRFCQMILNGGTLDGKRYFSGEAVEQMTTKQTGEMVKEGYGLGWSLRGASFGHGGAYSTSMNIDPPRGLITVFMVQHAGFPGQEGLAVEKAFTEAARTLSEP